MQSHQICVIVYNVSGESLEFKLPVQATVAQLRASVEELWQVPASLQKLVIGSHVLRSPEQLADHCCPDLDLSVTLLLCSDEARTALEGANLDCTLQALEAIKQLGPRAGERERCAIEGLLQDPRDRIRVAAVGAFGSVLSDTDVHRMSLLSQCLADPCSRVRSTAVSALSQFAAKQGSADSAFEALSAHLQHPEAFVRRSAVCAVSRFKDKLDIRKVWMHMNLLFESYLPEVRATALEVLSQITDQGDIHALEAALARLEDPEACVRCAALTAVGCLAPRQGDWDITSHVIACLSDTDDDVREAALSQLPRLVSQNDEQIVDAVSTCLEHHNAGVRLDVPSALLKVASRGNRYALESVASRLTHQSHEVRQAAVCTLDYLAKGAEDNAVHVLVPYLEHARPETRAAAIQQLSKSQPGTGINVAIQKMADQDQGVRLAALDAVTRNASLSYDPRAIVAVGRLLGSTHAGTRLVALQALTKISKRGNKEVISILARCLKDTSPQLRLAAAEALACISSRGDTVALSALRTCRQGEHDRKLGVVAAAYKAESKIRSGG